MPNIHVPWWRLLLGGRAAGRHPNRRPARERINRALRALILLAVLAGAVAYMAAPYFR